MDAERARNCAKGSRQIALVEEIIERSGFPVVVEKVPAKYVGGGSVMMMNVPVYGTARIPYNSFRPLRKRLEEVGFVFEEIRNTNRALQGFVVHHWSMLD